MYYICLKNVLLGWVRPIWGKTPAVLLEWQQHKVSSCSFNPRWHVSLFGKNNNNPIDFKELSVPDSETGPWSCVNKATLDLLVTRNREKKIFTGKRNGVMGFSFLIKKKERKFMFRTTPQGFFPELLWYRQVHPLNNQQKGVAQQRHHVCFLKISLHLDTTAWLWGNTKDTPPQREKEDHFWQGKYLVLSFLMDLTFKWPEQGGKTFRAQPWAELWSTSLPLCLWFSRSACLFSPAFRPQPCPLLPRSPVIPAKPSFKPRKWSQSQSWGQRTRQESIQTKD